MRSRWSRHPCVPQEARQCAEQGSNELISVLGRRQPTDSRRARPNARFQARRRAGARHERTLFAVACKPLLGCWRPMPMPGSAGDRLPPPPRAPPWRQDAATRGGSWTMAPDTASGLGREGAWHHRPEDDRPAAPCPPSRAWPCWGTALPAALPAAGPSSTHPHRAGDANPLMA